MMLSTATITGEVHFSNLYQEAPARGRDQVTRHAHRGTGRPACGLAYARLRPSHIATRPPRSAIWHSTCSIMTQSISRSAFY